MHFCMQLRLAGLELTADEEVEAAHAPEDVLQLRAVNVPER